MSVSKDPSPADPLSSAPPDQSGWWIRILSPEESEKLLREEPRIPIDEFMADLEREFGVQSDG